MVVNYIGVQRRQTMELVTTRYTATGVKVLHGTFASIEAEQ